MEGMIDLEKPFVPKRVLSHFIETGGVLPTEPVVEEFKVFLLKLFLLF
jgi:hypothetical protein